MDNPKLCHEPTLLEDGTPYRPYFFDDTGDLQGFQGYLCRLCHSYYMLPDTEPLEVQRPDKWGGNPHRDFPVKLEGSNVCPAKLYDALKGTVL